MHQQPGGGGNNNPPIRPSESTYLQQPQMGFYLQQNVLPHQQMAMGSQQQRFVPNPQVGGMPATIPPMMGQQQMVQEIGETHRQQMSLTRPQFMPHPTGAPIQPAFGGQFPHSQHPAQQNPSSQPPFGVAPNSMMYLPGQQSMGGGMTSIGQGTLSQQMVATSAPARADPKVQAERRLIPPTLPPQMLIGFENHSVEMLCTLGKELVLELLTRMFSIVNQLKINIKGENKKDLDTVRTQLDYSRLIFLALTEVQLRIDLKLTEDLEEGHSLRDARPTDEQLLAILCDPTPVEEDPTKKELSEKFEHNREALIRLNCQLRKLEWMAINSEQGMQSGSGSNARTRMSAGLERRG